MNPPTLGMIFMFGASFAPNGYALCNGQLLQISQYQALFSVIGTTYGGDGMQNFALPTLTGPSGTTYVIAIEGVYPSRD